MVRSRIEKKLTDSGYHYCEEPVNDTRFVLNFVDTNHLRPFRLNPLATSRLVINNEFHHDLPPDLWDGDEITAQIHKAGKQLDALNLLPAPFPLEELLSPQDLRHIKRLYGSGD